VTEAFSGKVGTGFPSENAITQEAPASNIMEAAANSRGEPAVSDADDIFAFLADQLADHETTWSLGTFGAIAEFSRDPDEPVALRRGDALLAAVTARGAIRIEAAMDVRLFASESTTRESWNQRVAICLPESRCAMNRRTVLTAPGPDLDALREQDRDSPLFDLGLGALQVDLCVRVPDSSVAAQLMSYAGRPLFEPGNPAMSMILDANPHRVFASRVGRIEVFQPIPPADGKSPDGPHTHVLPKLLHHRRTHPATSRSRTASFRVPISIRHIRLRMRWASAGASTAPVTMPFRRCCAISAIRNSTPSSSESSPRWRLEKTRPSSPSRMAASRERTFAWHCASSRPRTTSRLRS
jgi:hypothetical protein